MPKPYVRKLPAWWWLKTRSYFYFMLRELTAVFVAAYCVILLVMLWKLKRDPTEFDNFLDSLQSPWAIAFHFIALLFAAYHSATWFNLTPQIMVIRLGEEKVSPLLIGLSNYVIWFAVSAFIMWIVLK